MAQQLINGAATPMWLFYLLLGAFAVIAFATAIALAKRISSPTVAAMGTAALALLAVTMLVTAAVTERAGSATLSKAQLEQAIPVLFGVVIPALLGAFCLICALWTLTFSLLGWRNRSVPRWFCSVGTLTGVLMLAGVTGAPGVEVLGAPWLICAGVWLIRSRPKIDRA